MNIGSEIKELAECVQVINFNVDTGRGDAEQIALRDNHLCRIIELATEIDGENDDE